MTALTSDRSRFPLSQTWNTKHCSFGTPPTSTIIPPGSRFHKGHPTYSELYICTGHGRGSVAYPKPLPRRQVIGCQPPLSPSPQCPNGSLRDWPLLAICHPLFPGRVSRLARRESQLGRWFTHRWEYGGIAKWELAPAAVLEGQPHVGRWSRPCRVHKSTRRSSSHLVSLRSNHSANSESGESTNTSRRRPARIPV